jgi:hypothetical protein
LNYPDGLKFLTVSGILYCAEKAAKTAESHLSICPKGAAKGSKWLMVNSRCAFF